MKRPRIWLSYLLEPPLRLLSCILQRLMGHSRLRIGTLTFWGPRDFLDTCAASVQRLHELDSELHTRLTTQQKLVFCYAPKGLVHAYFAWIFSIDDSYMAWQSDGVITRLVYAAQLATLIPRRAISMEATHALHSEAMMTTRLWLEAHGFPELVVDTFREQAI